MSEPIRIAFLGCGFVTGVHSRNLRKLRGDILCAYASRDAAKAEQFRQHYGGFASYGSYDAALDDPRVDAVVVAVPPTFHLDLALRALDAGKHVLVEKPLCTTVADCRAVVDAAAQRPGLVWVGLEYRSMPPIARLLAEVRAGAVGTVRMVAMREHRYPFLEKVADWNRFNRNTGGTLVEKCCHFFDLMHLVVGERPIRVFASGGQAVNHLDERYDGEVPDILDHAFVVVEFPGGARGVLDLCMFAEGSRHQEEVSVVGDLGKVEAFLPDSTVRTGTRLGGAAGVREESVTDARVAHEGFHHGASYVEHLGFLAAIRTGSVPEVGPDDGLWSVAVGVAAQRSIAEGRVVDLAEVLDD